MALPRRLHSFSPRKLMVLIGTACIALAAAGWVAYERSVVIERLAVRRAMHGRAEFFSAEKSPRLGRPRPPNMVRRFFGDASVDELVLVGPNHSAGDADRVRELFPEASVWKNATSVASGNEGELLPVPKAPR